MDLPEESITMSPLWKQDKEIPSSSIFVLALKLPVIVSQNISDHDFS